MERHRKISEENQHDRIMSAKYFPAENNLNRFPKTESGIDNSQFKGKNSEMVPFYNVLSEDLRISKILRRLSTENNPSAAIDLCKKLESAATNPSNLLYIRRALDFISESIISILGKGPVECLNYLAKVYGIFGYIGRQDFPIYKSWIFKNYDNCKDIRVYLMRALKVTFREDANSRELGIYSNRVFQQLKDYLEGSEAVDEFIAVSDCIAEFSNNYQTFEKHFTDIVDIIVGWHLESEQSTTLKIHCSKVLQNFSEFFVRKLDFTLGLLRQFLEDISVFGDDIENSVGNHPEITVGSFIGALNTVIKCMVHNQELIAFKLGQQCFNEAVIIITRVAKLSLNKTSSVETVQSINEFFVLIINHGEILISYNPNEIFELIKIQEKYIDEFDDTQICCLLFLVLTLIKKLKTSTPIKLIEFILHRNSNGFSKLKFSKNEKIYKLFLKIYHEILIIKNVPLLQEAYKNILADAKISIKIILYHNEETNDNINQAECSLNFYLSALSILATQTSSIIGMYALQPSLLELLLKELEASNVNVWLTSPSLYRSILNFLIAHCKKNNNYLLSSNLLSGSHLFSKMSLDDISPTSENFSYILKFHVEFLTNAINCTQIPSETCNVILNWLNSILLQCWEQADILKENLYIEKIGLKICKLSNENSSNELNLNIAKCMTTLIIKHPNIKKEVFQQMYKICCIHMCSTKSCIRNEYSEVFAKLPLSITLSERNVITDETIKSQNKISILKQWLNSSTTNANIRDKHFKQFIDDLGFKQETKFLDTNLIELLTKCWIPNKKKSIELYKCTINNLTMIIHWIESEAGQYCVNNKLRTSLGKPQDTFLKIEALIKEYVRALTQNDQPIKDIETILANQKHARILLGFLEFLEKSIYNACEGTAFSMNSPEKPAKIFFRVNISTCNEWFKRIRNAVNLIGLNCSEPDMVIRYSEVMLRNMVNDNQINDSIFNISLTSFATALVKTNGSETLNGLYIWLKQKTNKRFSWIKFAAEQAAGYYEKAADGYLHILNSASESINFDRIIRDFVSEQLKICFDTTRQWEPLKLYLTKNSNDSLIKAKQIDDIINFEKNFESSLIDLSNWEQFDDDLQNVNNNFSYDKLITLTENSLLNIMLTTPTKQNESENNLKQLNRCKLIIQSGIQESFRTGSTEYLNNYIILSNVVENIVANGKNDHHLYKAQKICKSNDFLALMKIKRWSDYLNRTRNSFFIYNYDELHLNIISLSRKNANLKLCETELKDFFIKRPIGKLFDGNLRKISDYVQLNTNCLNTFTENDIRGLCETSKLLLTQNDNEENGINLAACCTLKIIEDMTTKDIKNTIFPEKSARLLLNISDWITLYPETISSTTYETPLVKLISTLDEILPNSDDDISSVIPATDMIVGKLIHLSVKQCSSLAKSWSALGNWYYRWGRKVIEAKTDINAGLSDKDIDSIKLLISNANEEDLRGIVEILNNHQVIVDDEEIDINERSSTDLIEHQLRTIDALRNISSEIITAVIGIWRQAHKSKSLFYEKAADAYFKYLNLSTNDEDDTNDKHYGECVTITATLRLLRLVVKHAFGLQDVLEEGLSTTPTRPWKAIIPQLFSRLNHHEQYVRKRVSELLCRVAKDSPHLIIFPAVVGAAQNDFNSADENKTAPLTLCFNSLLDTLYKQAPETVEQVQLLERELKRISILWDEFWLHALTQIYSEYSELFNSFENEVRKCSSDEKITLLTAKHKILIGHVVNDLQRLQNYTNRPPETNNEKYFQEKYSKLIESTIDGLAKSSLNIEKPNESWQKIKQIYFIFQQKVQKTVQTSLKMSDISPVLAELKNTWISMPGVETTESKPIYIRSVDNTVNILPTKTKPKKLALYGSDGKKYTYLFKGLEDLHLDERIMQFLSISNSMMAKSNGIYRAHHYSVIPLGPQSGLISWVDEMTPLFALYKKWQQREAVHPQIKKDKPFTVMRPSEMFYKKLNPLMAEQNLKTTDNRKTWPIDLLRKVLTELTNETPKDLLSKELWCHSNNANDWRQSIKNYSRSVAVMSVIGYVIGLGDRHLDNVLIKLSTGNIVHIDYNVCFEKGKTLRVPERVPFRMTQNLEEALGITGMEGIFRITCEHVLKTLRKEREILLTLLEAFVYDPLVDWAVSDDGTSPGYSNYTSITRSTKALMAASDINALKETSSEIECTTLVGNDRRKPRKKIDNEDLRNTLKIRFSEIKPEWMQYKTDLTVQLKLISDSLNNFESKRFEIQENENKRDFLSKQLAMVQEIETLGTAMGSHTLNTISQRYSNYKKTLDDLNIIQGLFTNKLNEYSNVQQIYLKLGMINFKDLLNNQLKLMISRENEFELCKGFLENSAQMVYIQADQAWKNFGNAQINLMSLNFDSLEKYANIISLTPRSYIKKHKYFLYYDLGKYLLENPSEINKIKQKMYDFELEENLINSELNEKILNYAYTLEKLLHQNEFNLNKNYELIHNSNAEIKQNVSDNDGEAIFVFSSSTPSPKIILSAFLSNISEILKDLSEYDQMSIESNSTNCSFHSIESLEKPTLVLSQLMEATQLISSITKQTNWKHLDLMNALFAFVHSLNKIETIFKFNITTEILKIIMRGDVEMNEIFEDILQLETIFGYNLIYNLGKNNNIEQILNLLNKYFKKIRSQMNFREILNTVDEIFEETFKKFTDALRLLKENENKLSFESIDHICTARNIMASLELSFIEEQLEIIKITTIIQIISISYKYHKSLLNNDLDNIYDFNYFNQIITNSLNAIGRNLLPGFVVHLGGIFETELLTILGLESSSKQLTCDELLFTAVQQNISTGFFSVTNYSRAQSLWKTFLTKIELINKNENLKKILVSQTNTKNHMQIICTVHYWMNDKFLIQHQQQQKQHNIFGHIYHKNIILQNLHATLENIHKWQISTESIKNELNEIGTAISQRLKWAAGANQSLYGLQQSFEELHLKNQNYNNNLFDITNILSSNTSIIVTFEELKFNSQLIDNDFLMIITEFSTCHQNNIKCIELINPIEKGIVELLNPEGYIDHQWINNICDLLNEITNDVQNKIANIEKDINIVHDNLLDGAVKLRALFDNELRIDVRYLLKLILKIDNGHQAHRQKLFLNNYKQFLNQISDLHVKILSRDFTQDNCRSIQKLIDTILVDINEINEELLNIIMKGNSYDNVEQNDKKSSDTPVRDRKKGNQPEQKRNAYAVSVWRRIRMKLEGRDPDPNRRQTVTEQVDWMIREATNPDNLAVLYEGWTPWV